MKYCSIPGTPSNQGQKKSITLKSKTDYTACTAIGQPDVSQGRYNQAIFATGVKVEHVAPGCQLTLYGDEKCSLPALMGRYPSSGQTAADGSCLKVDAGKIGTGYGTPVAAFTVTCWQNDTASANPTANHTSSAALS